jgi:spore coat polysaccharide biosynthesis protein SpsF (cytidylyltransferase family)
MYSGDQNRFHRPFTTHFVDVPAWYVKEKLKNAAVDTPEDFERVRAVVEKE